MKTNLFLIFGIVAASLLTVFGALSFAGLVLRNAFGGISDPCCDLPRNESRKFSNTLKFPVLLRFESGNPTEGSFVKVGPLSSITRSSSFGSGTVYPIYNMQKKLIGSANSPEWGREDEGVQIAESCIGNMPLKKVIFVNQLPRDILVKPGIEDSNSPLTRVPSHSKVQLRDVCLPDWVYRLYDSKKKPIGTTYYMQTGHPPETKTTATVTFTKSCIGDFSVLSDNEKPGTRP